MKNDVALQSWMRDEIRAHLGAASEGVDINALTDELAAEIEEHVGRRLDVYHLPIRGGTESPRLGIKQRWALIVAAFWLTIFWSGTLALYAWVMLADYGQFQGAHPLHSQLWAILLISGVVASLAIIIMAVAANSEERSNGK